MGYSSRGGWRDTKSEGKGCRHARKPCVTRPAAITTSTAGPADRTGPTRRTPATGSEPTHGPEKVGPSRRLGRWSTRHPREKRCRGGDAIDRGGKASEALSSRRP